ncbi:MAG: serine/threonine-protein kinase [Planctomycetota bacterium]
MSDGRVEMVTVDSLALEYLRATEAGEQPDVEALVRQLGNDADRDELRQLCTTAAWARSLLPAPFRPQLTVAGRYVLLEPLGSGGFGRVWRAHDRQLGREVALKAFHPLLDERDVDAVLQRELRALGQVRHDGVVRLFDSGRHEGTPFVVMEHVDGQSLAAVVERLREVAGAEYPPTAEAVEQVLGAAAAGTPEGAECAWPDRAARIAVDALWALAAAHAAGIVHRDLKPANVLLRPGGRPVLVDFGLSSLADASGELTGRLLGTAAYLAPEQLERARMGKDVRTDVYQMGLVLYELLTLRPAFAPGSQSQLLTAVRRGAFAQPRRVRPALPAALEDVCLRALELDPARRYPTADAFRDDLERWLAGALPQAARLGRMGRIGRGLRTGLRRQRVPLAIAAALMLGAAGTILATPGGVRVVLVGLDGQRTTVEVVRGAVLMLYEVGVDADGQPVAAPRAYRLDAGGPVRFAAAWTAGTSAVELVGDAPVVAGGALRAVPAPGALAADWDRFGRALNDRVEDLGRPLQRGEIADLLAELQRPARGGAPVGPLRIDDIFG